MKKKSILAILLTGIMCLTLVACGNTASQSSSTPSTTATATSTASESAPGTTSGLDNSKITIGLVVKFQHEFYNKLIKGAQDASNELGCTLKAQSPKDPSDIMGQVQMVEDLVTSGVNALLVAPNQADTLVNAMDKAVNNGAVIVAVDTDLPNYKNKTTFVGTGNKNALEKAGEKIGELLGKDANVIVLRGPLGDANHELRSAGATAGLENAGCKVLEVYDANSTSDKAAAATENFISKYGKDGIDGFLCCDDDMAAGTIQALKQIGLDKKILVSGFDGNSANLKLVEEGSQAFDMAQNPYDMGYKAVYAAVDALNGKKVESVIDTGVTLINKDNVATFQ